MINRPHIDLLVWDDWNRDHIGKHAVRPEEAEEVVAGEPTYRQTYRSRLQVVGPTVAGRLLTVIIGPVPDQAEACYVFSARPASRKERQYYAEQKGGSHP